jgi:putative chitinase
MITPKLLKTVAGRMILPLAEKLAPEMERQFPDYDVAGEDRISIFLAQACHETAGFATLEEYGGAKWFARYDGREDLGNTEPGDGARYHGRGIFMLTGRANYRQFGWKINADLEKHPERAAEPALSVRIALEYWKDRGLNALADKRDFLEVTRRINGGWNGLDHRMTLWGRAWLQLRKGA